MTREDGTWNNNNEKRLETVLAINKQSTTIAKLGGLKMRNTRMNKINDDGLNDYEVNGIKHSIRINTILESGETEAQRRGKLGSKTELENGTAKGHKNSRAKRINIYNQNEELIFQCFGNFKEICINNDLPFKSLSNSYRNNNKLYQNSLPTNKKFILFTGWFAKELKEIK